MASIVIEGYVNAIKYLQGSCIVYVDEFRSGYRRSSGERVPDRWLTWKVLFKEYFKKFVSMHFGEGMRVRVLGEALPYAVDKGEYIDGYTIVGLSINLCPNPKNFKKEKRLLKDSENMDMGIPDPESFIESDF